MAYLSYFIGFSDSLEPSFYVQARVLLSVKSQKREGTTMTGYDGLENLISRLDEINDQAPTLEPGVRRLVEELSLAEATEKTSLVALPSVPGRRGRTLRKWCSRNRGINGTKLRRMLVVRSSFELLVANPYTSLEWLANRVGYTRYSSLVRVWRKEVGITPAMAAGVIMGRPLRSTREERVMVAARLVDAEVGRNPGGGVGLRYTPSRRCR